MEKRLIGFILILCLVFAACGGSETTDSEKVPVPPASMFMVRNYHFCSDQETDRFLLGYYGNDLSDTLVYFYIIDTSGDTIFRDQWPSVYMLPNGAEPNDVAIMEAMTKMIDTHPVMGDICGESGSVYTYADQMIGYCASQKEVIEL